MKNDERGMDQMRGPTPEAVTALEDWIEKSRAARLGINPQNLPDRIQVEFVGDDPTPTDYFKVTVNDGMADSRRLANILDSMSE